MHRYYRLLLGLKIKLHDIFAFSFRFMKFLLTFEANPVQMHLQWSVSVVIFEFEKKVYSTSIME